MLYFYSPHPGNKIIFKVYIHVTSIFHSVNKNPQMGYLINTFLQ